jgi:hypothetical protein
MMRRKKEWLSAIEAELLQVTWHPKRLAWVLPIDRLHLVVREEVSGAWGCGGVGVQDICLWSVRV